MPNGVTDRHAVSFAVIMPEVRVLLLVNPFERNCSPLAAVMLI